MLLPLVGSEHVPLYFSGSGRSSQETATSGSCQQDLFNISNRAWVWVCIWNRSQVEQSLDGLSFSLCSILSLHISSLEYIVSFS